MIYGTNLTYYELLSGIMQAGEIIRDEKDGEAVKEICSTSVYVDLKAGNFFGSSESRPLEKIQRYLYGELEWYYSHSPKVSDITQYSKFWDKLADENGEVNSNYGKIVYGDINEHGFSQFDWVVNQFMRNANSKRAIAMYNSPQYYYEGNKDFICTQCQQFLIRDGELYSIVYIRSSDAIFGLTYDIPWWSLVQQDVLRVLKNLAPDRFETVRLGGLIVFCGSAHIYENKWEMVDQMLTESPMAYSVELVGPPPNGMEFGSEEIKNAIGQSIELKEAGRGLRKVIAD